MFKRKVFLHSTHFTTAALPQSLAKSIHRTASISTKSLPLAGVCTHRTGTGQFCFKFKWSYIRGTVRAPYGAHQVIGRCFMSRTVNGPEATCNFRSTYITYMHIPGSTIRENILYISQDSMRFCGRITACEKCFFLQHLTSCLCVDYNGLEDWLGILKWRAYNMYRFSSFERQHFSLW